MGKAQILIVEDDAIAAMDIGNQLKSLGYGVTAKVSNGKDAIQKAKENTPDLVLMDIILKGEIDGIEAATEIRTQFDIPVVFLTAFADKNRLEKAKLTNPFGYILKPFQDKDLEVTIEMALYVAKVDADRKQSEEMLQESEEKFRTSIENMLDGFALFSAIRDDANQIVDFRYEYINQAGCMLNQRTREEQLGHTLLELLPMHQDTGLLYEYVQVIETDKPLSRIAYVYEDVFRGDRVLSRAFDFQAVKVGDGFVATWRDVTERVQSEEALRESEGKYRSLVESTEDSICLVDRNCAYLFMNEKYLSRVGLPADKIIGREYGAFHSAEETKEFTRRAKEVFETGKSIAYEDRSERDGKYFLRTLSPVKKPDGKITKFTVISKNITERKQAEQSLQEAEAELKHTIEVMPGIISKANAHTGYFTHCNPALSNILGFSLEEFLARPFIEFVHPDDRQSTINEVEKQLKGSPVARFENRYICKDGSYKWLEWRATAVDKKGVVYAAATDITERKQAEEALRESREQLRNLSKYLQSSREQERTSIAREIHDELGQNLTGLKMDASWLKKNLPKDLKSQAKKIRSMIKLIDETVKTTKLLISQLRPGLLDDLGLVAAIEWQAEDFQDRTGIKTEVVFDPEEIDLDEEVSTSLFRIFQEAITNIVRHAAATEITASLKEKDGTIELMVRDNGKGITKGQISGHQSFGLLGMRERAYVLGGKVEITGVRGKGTTLMVSIPIGELL